ncbi:VOC family protein [Anderseniella sp. Alg231-50]|uniref:VOC family protein n=1 Tax=Anderseniella sp. Alg231-50 TaxID=1922226 RepID=UPI000D55B85E
MQRSFTNVLSEDVSKTAAFYENLLGMTRHFESDWFVILTHEDIQGLEFGILQRDHAIVPADIRAAPAGVIVTFVVADCDEVYRKAVAAKAPIIEPPADMPYGQRRMLLRDPDGTVLDVSAPTAPIA